MDERVNVAGQSAILMVPPRFAAAAMRATAAHITTDIRRHLRQQAKA